MRIIAGTIILFLLICVAAWIYISYNKASILQTVKKELNSRINGQISIGDIDASFFQTFPNVSFGLTNVTIRDSLWRQHHHDLLQANKIFANLNIFKLFTGQLYVDKVIIDKATIYLYTDSTGYDNTKIVKAQKSASTTKSSHIPSIEIKNSKLFVEKADRNKFFSFGIDKLTAKAKESEEGKPVLFNINLSAVIHTMAFNRDHGSFVEEKPVSGKFKIEFNPNSKILEFENIKLSVDRHPFIFTGKFFLNEAPAPFKLSIQTENISYRNATSLLTPNIRKKMDLYDIGENIIRINTTLDGTDPEDHNPIVKINMTVKNSVITTPFANFSNASFNGTFTNEVVKGQGRVDQNSSLTFKSFSGTWQNVKLNSDTVIVTNLVQPFLSCDFHSDFDVTALNTLTDYQTIEFTKGKGILNIVYHGPIQEDDSLERSINGTIVLDSASFNYLPRSFSLKDCSGKIRFMDKDMFMEDFVAHTSGSELNINADIKNLFSLIDKNSEKPVLNCLINSPKLNIDDFTAFLKRKKVAVEKKKRKILFVKTVSKIMAVLNDAEVRLRLNAKQLTYKNFNATNVSSGILLNTDKVQLNDLRLSHAGGSLILNGSLLNNGEENSVLLRTKMSKMDINKLFSSFDNFGQHGIVDKNIKGKIDADVNLSGLISAKAEIISNSLKGTIDFNIRDGELIQFEPVEKISQFAFKNRDFSDIQFAELKNKLVVNGSEIKVNRMEIHSTVLVMFVEGIYDMKKGTDMSIQIPLSNLKEKNLDIEKANRGVKTKTGVSVRLRAKTGDDGKLKISWDPFKKALKSKKT
ncbi:MAG: AsmA family protein [Bacteroidetes bacterium]|nr:AsmA family protein [Bacteroidota bacterium]